MRKYLFVLSAICCIAFTSCGDFKEITFSGIQSITITSLNQKGVEAIITAKIKNPNGTAFTIYKSDMDVSLSGISAGKAHITKNVRIKAKSEELYTFEIKSDFSNLNLADLPKIISMAMSSQIKITLKGNLKAGKLFVKRSYPVDLTQSVPIRSK